MRRRDFYWSLVHRTTNNQLNDLRTSQVEAIFAAIPEKDKPQWLIWKEGFKTWKPFIEFPILLKDLRNVKQAETLPPPLPKQKIEIEEQRLAEAIEKELSMRFEKRSHSRNENRKTSRFDGKFRVQIRIGSLSFESSTSNISMEGMLLTKALPKWVPKYFTVELYANEIAADQMIPLLCSRLKSSAGDRIRIESNDNCEILRRWLVSTTY